MRNFNKLINKKAPVLITFMIACFIVICGNTVFWAQDAGDAATTAPTTNTPTSEATAPTSEATAPTAEATAPTAEATAPKATASNTNDKNDKFQIRQLEGDVKIKPTNQNNYIPTILGDIYKAGTSVKVEAAGKCVVSVGDGILIRIFPNSELNIKRNSASEMECNLLSGKIYIRTGKITGKITISSPIAKVDITGTKLLMDYNVDENANVLYMQEGTVQASNIKFPNNIMKIEAGRKFTIAVADAEPSGIDITDLADTDKAKLVAVDKSLDNLPALPKPAEIVVPPVVRKGEEKRVPLPAGDATPATDDTNKKLENTKEKKVPIRPYHIEGGRTPISDNLPINLNLYTGPMIIGQNKDMYKRPNDKVMYAQFIFELGVGSKYEDFEFGLYLPLFLDISQDSMFQKRHWANEKEWNFESWQDAIHDVLTKIKILRSGKWEERLDTGFYFQMGNLENIEFGHGFVLDSYNNSPISPLDNKFGMLLYAEADAGGIELLATNIDANNWFQNSIYGARFVLRFLTMTEVPILSKFGIGASVITDVSPREGDETPIFAEDGKTVILTGDPSVYFATMDLELPILYKADFPNVPFRLKLYTDISKQGYSGFVNGETVKVMTSDVKVVRSNNYGVQIGMKSSLELEQLGGISVPIKFEYRRLNKGFKASYFDQLYEVEKKTSEKLLGIIAADPNGNYNSYLVGLGYAMKKIGKIYYSYEEVIDFPVHNNRAHFNFELAKSLVPHFYCTFAYDRINSGNWDNFWNDFLGVNSIMSTRWTYIADNGIELSFIYRKFFKENDNGLFENEELYGFETEVVF